MSALVISQALPTSEVLFPVERTVSATTPLEDKPVLPATSNAAKNSPQETIEKMQKAQENLNEKENQGFSIPGILKKIADFIEHATQRIVMYAGYFLKYAGFIFLMAGIVQFIFILGTSALPTIMAGGFIALIFDLIKQGSLPCILGGVTIFKLGSDLTANNTKEIGSSISTASWVFPSLLYTWVAQVPPPNPGNPMH